MKKILFHVIVVFTFVLMLPFAVLASILVIYLGLVQILLRKPCAYVRGTEKIPKWFGYFSDYIVYITNFTK